MPFYKFTITLVDRSIHSGIRELLDQPDINAVWRKYEAIAQKKYGYQFQEFKVVMLSKIDPEVKDFLAARGKTKTNPMDGIWDDMPEAQPFKNRKDLHAESMDRRGKKEPRK